MSPGVRRIGWARAAAATVLMGIALSVGHGPLPLRTLWATARTELAALGLGVALCSVVALRMRDAGRLSALADLASAPLWIAIALAGDVPAAMVAAPLLVLRGARGLAAPDVERWRRGRFAALCAALLLTMSWDARWGALAVAAAVEMGVQLWARGERQCRLLLCWLQLVAGAAISALACAATTRFAHAEGALQVVCGLGVACAVSAVLELALLLWRGHE